jgi:hypothetical protein
MCPYPYRVFICYSREDAALEGELRRHLLAIGINPMSDVDIPAGVPFPEEIKAKIGFAHVFIPLLTEKSSGRPWVNQEIGYAMALGVPIIPLAVGKLPVEGMTERLQARILDQDLGNLPKMLTMETIKEVVDRAIGHYEDGTSSFPVTCGSAYQIYQRSQMLVNYARGVQRLHYSGRVRQLVAFGSFTIPNKDSSHVDWDKRDGKRKRPPDLREWLRQEREVMEEHALDAGCDLILDPYVAYSMIDELGVEAAIARIEFLLEFIDQMPDEKINVVIDRGRIKGSLFAVGDWFAAEAVVSIVSPAGGGYEQTIFTRHAPTVMKLTQAFDRRLRGLLPKNAESGVSSRRTAMRLIEEVIRDLKSRPGCFGNSP